MMWTKKQKVERLIRKMFQVGEENGLDQGFSKGHSELHQECILEKMPMRLANGFKI